MYALRKILPGLVLLLHGQMGAAETCLSGFELTAMVVFENDIKQSVESYACRMAHPEHELTYDLYKQLRQHWTQQRADQRIIRDRVYWRIYGNNWRDKIAEWERATAIREAGLFKPEMQACRDLRMKMLQYIDSWKSLFADAARKAAGKAYDPLRCADVEAG